MIQNKICNTVDVIILKLNQLSDTIIINRQVIYKQKKLLQRFDINTIGQLIFCIAQSN